MTPDPITPSAFLGAVMSTDQTATAEPRKGLNC